MKRIILSLICVFILAVKTEAQENNKGIYLSGGFGGSFVSFTSFQGESTYAIGGGGAILLNKNYFIGGFGQGTSDMHATGSKLPDFEDYVVQTEYGGLWFGYILRKNYKLDFNLSVQTAWGQVRLNNRDTKQTIYDEIFVLVPGLSINYRVGNIMKLQAFTNYSIFYKVDLETYSSHDFSKLAYGLKIMFGLF